MLIPDGDAAELRKWTIKRLEAISADVDEDVLADYVIALLRSEASEQQLKVDACSNLEDFLKENTSRLVDEVFTALHDKSYLPGHVSTPTGDSDSHTVLPHPSRSSVPVKTTGVARNAFSGSRKRSYNDHLANAYGSEPQHGRGHKQIKPTVTTATGMEDGLGNNFDRGRDGPDLYNLFHTGDPELPFYFPNFPLDPRLPANFNPNDHFAAMATLQATGMPDVPRTLQNSTHKQNGKTGHSSRMRCRDYDTIGFCAKGGTCPYQHGMDQITASSQDEYDPKNAVLMSPSISPAITRSGSNLGRGNVYQRGQGKGRGAGKGTIFRRSNRADFSHAGPNHDQSITTIVVEQIPEEKFNEQSVRDFFSQFGTISEVRMQAYRRLALVEYEDYFTARKAYDSPKVIFDNRFVKVYWYKPSSLPGSSSTIKNGAGSPSAATAEEQPFDREGFEKRVHGAQKKLEEKKKFMEDMNTKREAIERQKEELEQKQTDEKRKLMERLAAKNRGSNADTFMNCDKPQRGLEDDPTNSASTKALRIKLAELEAEAKSLGIEHLPHDQHAPRLHGSGRGRGSYRGWGMFAGRGSLDHHRGSFRGRGTFRSHGGGKYNLDLRTRRVCISGVDWTNERDEALRQHLLGVGEFEAIDKHPDEHAVQIVTFKDRQTAESFVYGPRDVPSLGKLEFHWYNAPSAQKVSKTEGINGDVDVNMNVRPVEPDHDLEKGTLEVDYDVAEEDDRWT